MVKGRPLAGRIPIIPAIAGIFTAVVFFGAGEGVTGAFAIGEMAFLVGILPAGILIAVGVAVSDPSPAANTVLIVLGGVILVVVLLVQVTISAVFKVVLFRFAADGRVLAGFEQQDLEAAFKHGRRL